MKFLEKLWLNHFKKCVVLSFWLLGLCNNFAYVIMLSAAHDILSSSDSNSTTVNTTNTTNKYDCNDLSTATILLADILPGFFIKLKAPFFAHKIKYNYKIIIIIIVNASSYLFVALAPPSDYQWLIFLGVICASLSSSFGEITLLSLSTFYDRNLSLSGWGSGTGAAGLIGSFGYAGLTSLGLKPRTTILSMLFIPFLMGFSYMIMPSIKIDFTQNDNNDDQEESASLLKENPVSNRKKINFKAGLYILKPLIKYMIPIFLVYFSEYFINQGLFELMYFRNSFLKEHKLQYRWYNVIYQLAVFLSRSSIGYIKIKFLFLFPLFQLINVVVVLSQIFLDWMPNIWIAFVLIFWEGLLGGGCYVNAFYRISIEIDKQDREFSIAIASIADSVGIALAGFTSIPTHNSICNLGRK